VVPPSTSAEDCTKAVATEACTVLYADAHTFKSLAAIEGSPASGALRGLRAGLVKIGSGDVFGDADSQFLEGVEFITVGKGKK
jgi:hypothetical protein